MNHKLLSVIIPARNESPSIYFTFHSIMNCLEADGIDYRDVEIIIVDNCSDDRRNPQRGTWGTTDYLAGRGSYWNRIIRIVRDPLAGNHSARNTGARIAVGKYLFFSDAHVAHAPGFFKNMIKACEESGGMVHAQFQYMGAYPPQIRSSGLGYTIKLGEEIKGTWHGRQLSNDWFYIFGQGHWAVMVSREQFLDFGGYPAIHRTYGGGEFYINSKWWMFGSCCVVEPKAIGYHLASGRNYSYNQLMDYTHNLFNIGLALGMDDWVERTYINKLRKINKPILDKMMDEARVESEQDRKFIDKRKKMTFNEMIVNRPWDIMNDKKIGRHDSSILIYHDTWKKHLAESPVATEVYNNSKYQKDLEKLIRENLQPFVYRPDPTSSTDS